MSHIIVFNPVLPDHTHIDFFNYNGFFFFKGPNWGEKK